MKLHKAIKKANDEKDIESLMPLYHEDFEFVRHQSGTSLLNLICQHVHNRCWFQLFCF
jgi:hypothetical protein